jgi:hypothetical protein
MLHYVLKSVILKPKECIAAEVNVLELTVNHPIPNLGRGFVKPRKEWHT